MPGNEQNEQTEAIARLREILKPGDTVHTILRHASRSGMSRSISVIVAQPADYRDTPGDTWEPVDISWMVVRALGWRFDPKNGGVKVGGCGMDMGFHLVYTLSRVLFGDGFGLPCRHCGERPESEAGADAMRQARCPVLPPLAVLDGHHEFYGRNGCSSGWDRDGGYALSQRWL